MPFKGLPEFIDHLEKSGELLRISTFADPVLEITEITDRISKNNGPALLFQNNGTKFPLLINAFGSERRMASALSRTDLKDPAAEIEKLFKHLTASSGSFSGKLTTIPSLLRISRFIPSRRWGRGRCQQVIRRDPDLEIFPVLKCWPFDSGRFITLPIVHTYHPVTRKPNAGMYRMQILDKKTTAMHWQMHKTGANHYEEWRKAGKRMPVSVVLGGDPVYTYTATAPLPENMDEYLLAGFLRHKKVKLVKCITNDIYVPCDADVILEGYVDPEEEKVLEGPFGDHTGFYSLADWYPKFHLTCITHSADAVYPATIVGIPPMEDAFFSQASEKIFLGPLKFALQPEIEDLHLPDAGVSHNLVVVRINKSYPGQGMKVINSLMGAGQMMFSKYIVVVSGDINIRDYTALATHVLIHTDPSADIVFNTGPLDVLDHSSDTYTFGGKAGIDATVKLESEQVSGKNSRKTITTEFRPEINSVTGEGLITDYYIPGGGIPEKMLIVSADVSKNNEVVRIIGERISQSGLGHHFRLVIVVDHTVNVKDLFMVAWQLLGNSDPKRDHTFIHDHCLLIDATIKSFRPGGFPRHWPDVVCSDEKTIENVDRKWNNLGAGALVTSPSKKYRILTRGDSEEIK